MASISHYKYLGNDDDRKPLCTSTKLTLGYIKTMAKVSTSKLPDNICPKCITVLKSKKLIKA
jgi:hypothetical protein